MIWWLISLGYFSGKFVVHAHKGREGRKFKCLIHFIQVELQGAIYLILSRERAGEMFTFSKYLVSNEQEDSEALRGKWRFFFPWQSTSLSLLCLWLENWWKMKFCQGNLSKASSIRGVNLYWPHDSITIQSVSDSRCILMNPNVWHHHSMQQLIHHLNHLFIYKEPWSALRYTSTVICKNCLFI